MNDYQKELWKKRQEYELAHKDNSKLPAKPKKKKKKVKSNTDNYVTGKVKQTTNKATKDAKNKAHMQDLVNTSKTKQATKKATKDAKRNAHTNDYSNITDSTKNGKKKKSKLKHSDLYLAHHGVEGQKWGVKHGPPYPLGSDVSTGNKLKSNMPHKRISANRMRNYSKSEQARISEGQELGARIGGLPGAMVGSYLTKRRINRENAGLRDKKYTNEERVRINNALETYGLVGTALSRRNVKKENERAAQKEALSIVDNMDGFNKEDFEISKTKRTEDGNNYIIELTHKGDKELKAFIKVSKDTKSGKMSVSNIGLTEEDAKHGTKESNAEKIKAKYESYSNKSVTNGKKSGASLTKPKISDAKIKEAIRDNMKDVKDKNGNPYIDTNKLKRLGYDPETKQDTWTDGNGNYFTLELYPDPKTGKDVIDPRLITWDD